MWWRAVVRPDETPWARLRGWLDPVSARPVPVTRELLEEGASWSGFERDHFFLNVGGEEFVDLAGVVGLDSIADGRSTAVLDYDRDGWPDLAVVNANSPQLLLYRNEIGGRVEHRSVAVGLVGGSRAGEPGRRFSNRDGIGARLEFHVGERVLRREVRAGEGFASQSSKRITLGLGAAEQVDALVVRWPSGREQRLEGVPAGSFVRFFEDPTTSPDGSGVVVAPRVGAPTGAHPTGGGPAGGGPRRSEHAGPILPGLPRGDSALQLYTSTATWCLACAAEAEDLDRLRAAFAEDELAITGVAVDPADDRAALDAWSTRVGARHEILSGLPRETLAVFEQVVIDELKRPALPAALITDAEGRLVHAQFGSPSVSTVRRLLAEVGAR